MHILRYEESREVCEEAGWVAFDYLLEEPLTSEDIQSLRQWGSLVFLPMLKKPFFKVENHHLMMKGLLGEDFFRIAVHRESMELVEIIRNTYKKQHAERHSPVRKFFK